MDAGNLQGAPNSASRGPYLESVIAFSFAAMASGGCDERASVDGICGDRHPCAKLGAAVNASVVSDGPIGGAWEAKDDIKHFLLHENGIVSGDVRGGG